MPMMGVGFNSTWANNGSDTGLPPSSMLAVPFTATTDASGLYDLTLANADTYTVLGVAFNEQVNDLCFPERYSEGTTTAIRFRATDPISGANKTFSGSYIKISDI